MDILPSNKKHRKSKSNGKKKQKVLSYISTNFNDIYRIFLQGGARNGNKNPKAFNVANIGRTKKLQQRNLDRAQQKELVPLTNRQEAEDTSPPTVVVVMGPKGLLLFINLFLHYLMTIDLLGVGKTTLIRSLVKIFTKQNLVDAKGPITILAGRYSILSLTSA